MPPTYSPSKGHFQQSLTPRLFLPFDLISLHLVTVQRPPWCFSGHIRLCQPPEGSRTVTSSLCSHGAPVTGAHSEPSLLLHLGPYGALGVGPRAGAGQTSCTDNHSDLLGVSGVVQCQGPDLGHGHAGCDPTLPPDPWHAGRDGGSSWPTPQSKRSGHLVLCCSLFPFFPSRRLTQT